MKPRDLPKRLADIASRKGEPLELEEGGNHTKVHIGQWSEPIPRHREIQEHLAKGIIRRASR